MPTDKELNDLSKEELIEIIKRARIESDELTKKAMNFQKEAMNFQKEAMSLKEETMNLREENADLKRRNELLKIIIKQKNNIIKKAGLENFVGKSDNIGFAANREIRRKQSKERGKSGRREGSRNYGNMDFEKLSEGNEVIENDIREEYLLEHPDAELVMIGQDVSYVIEHVKAKMIVHKVVTNKYRDRKEESVVQAPAVSVINHCYASAGLLAYIVMAKYSLGLPVYRMRDIMADQGLEFNFNTIYGWLMRTAELLEPIRKAMFGEMTSGKFKSLNVDETNIRVMDTYDDNRQKSYMYLYGAEGEHVLRLFDFTGSRKSDRTAEILRDFTGTITVDGYSGYDSLVSDSISIQRCQVHLRREFTDIIKVMDKERMKDSAAYHVVALLDRIFAKEKEFREKGLNPFEILEARQSDEYQLMVEEADNAIVSLSQCELTGELKSAVGYYMHRREQFWTYLEDGEVTNNNNSVERIAKSFASCRKGFLFCRTKESAADCATLMSLVKTAEANGVYPDDYIEWCLKEIKKHRNPAELMPWSEECLSFRIDKK